jgi:hypothetical protein
VYAEAEAALAGLLPPASDVLDPRRALADAVRLNAARMRHPLADGRVTVQCDHDVHAFCEAIVRGEEPVLSHGPVSYEIEHQGPADLDTWLVDTVRDREKHKLADVVMTRKAPAEAVVPGA